MSNSPWTRLTDAPIPDGETTLLYLAQNRQGTRFATCKSQKIANGYMKIIDGLFEFDLGIEILAWRRLDDIEKELPLDL